MIGKTILHYKILSNIEKDLRYAAFLTKIKLTLYEDENANSVRSKMFIEKFQSKP